jgi:membrane dipeptidase
MGSAIALEHPRNAQCRDIISAVQGSTMHSFDGHNDALLRLWRSAGDAPALFLDGGPRGQLDLPKAEAGGMVGGLYAIFVPSNDKAVAFREPMDTVPYDVPLPPPPDMTPAQRATYEMASILYRIEARSGGRVQICRSVADIRAAKAAGAHAPVLHIEGCEAIDPEFAFLDVLYAAGLRSLGPVWSRSNIFGHGVPFRFPSSPDTGEGLTDLGKALIKRCNAMKILVDLSHLNEQGFWDIAKLSDAPLVATHSNVHALCASSRNLTDKQLAAIRETRGLVGVNYAVSFLRGDGRRVAETPLDTVVDHIAYLIEKLGEDGVGLGSDFDGAMIPHGIKSAAGLPNLVGAMRARQFGEALIEKVCFENWMRVLAWTWGEDAVV